jgi:hypothetical protein
METINLMDAMTSMRRMTSYLMHDERKHWEEANEKSFDRTIEPNRPSEDDDHIFFDVLRAQEWLEQNGIYEEGGII